MPAARRSSRRMISVRPASRASSRMQAEKSALSNRFSARVGNCPVISPDALWQSCQPLRNSWKFRLRRPMVE